MASANKSKPPKPVWIICDKDGVVPSLCYAVEEHACRDAARSTGPTEYVTKYIPAPAPKRKKVKRK